MLDQKKRTLKRLGIAGVATAMTTMGVPGIAGAATLRIAPDATTASLSAPGAPTNLKATDAGLDQITLSWTAPSGTVSGYNVYEGSASGAESSTPVNGKVLVTGTTDTVTVPNAGAFYFEVAAVNAAGVGAKSVEANATAAAIAPGVPSGVTASAADGGAVVSWTAPSSGGTPTGYTVNYGTSSSSLTSQMTVSGSATSAVLSGLTNATEYFFDVVATNAAGNSSPSSVVNTTPSTSAVPLPPTDVTAAPDGSGQVIVKWTDSSSSSVTGYNIYEGTSSGAESTTPINGSVPLSSTDTSKVVAVTNGTTAYFIVKAVNSAGSSVASNEAHATAAPTVTAVKANPSAPQNLKATVVGPTDVKLTWSAPASSGSSKVQEYFVEEASSKAGLSTGATATLVSPHTAGDNSTTGTSAIVTVPTATAYFGVYAENAASLNGTQPPTSPSTASTSATTTTNSAVIPGAPTIETVTTTGGSTPANTIKWKKASYTPTPAAGDEISYEIKRNGVVVGLAAGSATTTFTDSGSGSGHTAQDSAPTAGTTYSYQVTEVVENSTTHTVVSTGGSSGSVKVDTANFAPGAPTSLTATVPSNKTVSLHWTAPTLQGLTSGTLEYVVLENGSKVGSATANTHISETVTSSTASTNFTVEAESTSSGITQGTSGPSNDVAVVAAKPATTAAAPSGLTAAATSNSSIKLRWNASSTANNVAATHYKIFEQTTKSGLPGTAIATIDTSTSYTATDLTSGSTYYFEVEASPEATPPVFSNSASATTTTTTTSVSGVPGAPTGLKATVDGGLVDLSWTAPSSSGGSKISGYKIFSSTSSTLASTAKPIGSTSGTGTSAVLDNVGTSKVDLFVEAVNTSGSSTASAPVQVTPASFSQLPSAPGTPQVQAESGGKAFVLWTAPSSTGGTLTGYFVTAHLVGGTGKTIFVKGANTTSATVGGLVTGSYYFTVVAKNSIGGGTPSAPSNFVSVSSVVSATKVYVTPPAPRVGAGDVIIRVTVNSPSARVQLFDEAAGKNFFFSKAIKETTPAKYGNGVAEFIVHVDATNHFYVMVNGVKSNVVTAMVK